MAFIRFRLGIPNLEIEEKYVTVLFNFGKELDNISRIYNKEKTEPVVQRNVPPISGKLTNQNGLRQFCQPWGSTNQHYLPSRVHEFIKKMSPLMLTEYLLHTVVLYVLHMCFITRVGSAFD